MSDDYVTLTNGQIVRKSTLRRWEVERIVADHFRAAVPRKRKRKRNKNANRKTDRGVEVGVRMRTGPGTKVPVLFDDLGSGGDACIIQDDGNVTVSQQQDDERNQDADGCSS